MPRNWAWTLASNFFGSGNWNSACVSHRSWRSPLPRIVAACHVADPAMRLCRRGSLNPPVPCRGSAGQFALVASETLLDAVRHSSER